MGIEKEYYKLEEAVELLGATYKSTDLIYLGAHKELPIYVLAADWQVNAKHWEIWSDYDEDGVMRRDYMSATPDKIYTETLSGLIRIHPRTLSKFEHDSNLPLRSFFVEGNDEVGNPEWSEYWFNIDSNADIAGQLTIGRHNLIVLATDIARLEQGQICYASDAKEKIGADTLDPNYKAPKRKAPDDFVKELIDLLVTIAQRACKAKQEFSVKQMPGIKVDLYKVAIKFSINLEKKEGTFAEYLSGLCQFTQGGKSTDFYEKLFPEYFKCENPDLT